MATLEGMRHLSLLAATTVLLVLVPATARAGDEDPEEDRATSEVDDDPRPVRHASVEVNPLALAVDRVGGQAQVAIMGPLTMILGASRIEADVLKGWAYEVGSRLHFGLDARRSDGTRVAHVWVSATYLADALEQAGTRGERRGIALDVGVVTRIGAGFYALGGVGAAHRVSDLAIVDRFERMETTPRLTFAVGWGF